MFGCLEVLWLTEAAAQLRVTALTAFVRTARRETVLQRLFGKAQAKVPGDARIETRGGAKRYQRPSRVLTRGRADQN